MAIKNCSCKDPAMDVMYGPGKRVLNETKDGGYRCTTCSTKHLPNASAKKAAASGK